MVDVLILPQYGDVNGDGNVNSSDIETFVDVLIGTDTNNFHVEWSDLNGNGTTNAADVQTFVGAYLSNGN